MKIYGQPLPDIFAKLPWPYKIMTAAGSAFIAYTLLYVPYAAFWPASHTPSMLKAPEGTSGMTDPSLVFDAKNERAFLAYAAEQKGQMSVRVARGDAQCTGWREINAGFDGKPDTLFKPDGETILSEGAWRVETPTLIHDEADDEAPWKLYAYKYFWPKNGATDMATRFSAVVYKHAVDPVSGPWSQEQWLFSSNPPPAPYGQMVQLSLNALDPSLKKITAYARPSAVVLEGSIFMTLSAYQGGDTPDRVILIVSKDHGKSWAYAGTLLSTADAAKFGYAHIAGSTLLQKNKKLYLAASFGNDARFADGTIVFAFDGGLKLKKVNKLPLFSANPGLMGGGFAAYDAACPFGILSGEQSTEAPAFRIMKTFKSPED